MKKVKKIMIGAIILLSVCGCGKKEEMNNTPNEEIQEGETIKGNVKLEELKIELVSSKINEEEEVSEFIFAITNIANETKTIKEIKAQAKDKEGNDLIALSAVIEEEIKSGEKKEVNCSYGGILKDVDTFTYEVIN